MPYCYTIYIYIYFIYIHGGSITVNFITKVKENQRKKDVAYSKDIETVNRELCATCPRGMTLDTAAKCPIEVNIAHLKY